MPEVTPMNDMHMQKAAEAALVAPKIRLSNITKVFSGVVALSDVSVDIYPGEVHAILGENGAGKSTLMNIISGVLTPEHGEIAFDGQPVTPMSPEKAAHLGVAISYQHPAVLDDLGLAIPLHARADSLTVAQKHLLEIAKALATRPPVLILDEPTAALDQDATEMLFSRIRSVVAKGTAVIY